MATAPAEDLPTPLVRRHRLPTRIWHWINAAAVFVLLMSGLMIFNAHPRLYWGHYGANADRAWLEIGSAPERGFVKLGAAEIPTTGVLGHREVDGQVERRAFPGWATIPSYYSLSGARRWHLAFAWVLGLGLLSYHLFLFVSRRASRDLGPTREDVSPRHLWIEIKDHARLRFPSGTAALRYNSLQRLSYFAIIFLLLPLLILSGIGMAPGMDAGWPWVVDLLGGRQSARSIHFLCAMAMAAFIAVHVLMVVLAGPLNEMRAMITGWYRLPAERGER